MKVLALSHGLITGGAQVSTLEFLKLMESRAELSLLTCDNVGEPFLSQVRSLKIDVYRVPCKTVMGYPILEVHEVQKLIEWADVVWITDEIYLVALRVKRLRRVPVVAHLHSYALICPWWAAFYGFREVCSRRCSPWRIVRCKQGVNLELSRIGLLSGGRAGIYWLLDFIKGPSDFFRWGKLMDGVLDSIDGFIAVSEATRDIHVRHLPELGGRPSAVVYNPVTEPLEYVRPDPEGPYGSYIVYASGSNLVKGPHLLLEAWSAVSREFRDLKLYMVGCKSSWVESVAKKMNLKNVVFTERLPLESYYRLMYGARAVVMPSLWPEPFGRIPVEANRLGVPAVVTNRGALPEIIENNITGLVSKARSEDFANAIVKVVSQGWDRDKIIENSFKRINPDRAVDSLLKFFEELLR